MSGSPFAAAGNVITYRLVATNLGNVTLTNVTLSDPKLGALTCAQPVTLLPGQALTCTGTYPVTQADVNAGSVLNTATATGQQPDGATVSGADSATATAAQAPSLKLRKTITSGSPYQTPGQVIRYQFVATNAGNVTLTNVTISDPQLGHAELPATGDAAARPDADLHRQSHRDAGGPGRRLRAQHRHGRRPGRAGDTLRGTDSATARPSRSRRCGCSRRS